MKLPKQELLITAALVMFGLVFLFSSSGIFFEVSNSELEAQIDQLSETKENLRARYLSRISLAKLDRKASRLKMHHADASTSYTVSEKESRVKLQTLSHSLITKDRTTIISGY